MDSLTQMALGAAVGGAVMGRQAGWRAFAWGAGVAVLPDLDVVVDYGGAVADFTYHRGHTHSLFVTALAAPVIAWGIQRLHHRRGDHYLPWLLAVWLVLVTHVLLDAFTIYGTQLFLPFSDYPVGLGSIFIIDPLYTLPLMIGVVVALFVRHDWIRRRNWNAAGLILSTLYLLWTVPAQQMVESRATAEIRAQDLPVQQMMATPAPFNTVLWRIIVVGRDAHWEGFYTLGSGRPITFHEYANDPDLLADIEDEWPVRRLREFTKGFHAVNEFDGNVVITDLRMGQAGFYAFAFRVGIREHGSTRPVEDERHEYPRPPLVDALSDLLACARGESTELIAC